MRAFENGGRLVECVEDLPDLRHSIELFGDFETSSGHPKIKSLNPWRDCGTCGIAVTADEARGAWYVPVAQDDKPGSHYGGLPREIVANWWCDQVDTAKSWVNQNIKYDMHVSTNDLGVLPECEIICTLTQAKIIHSDRLRYGLDVLSQDWLGADISRYEQAMKPYLHQNDDYGAVPLDIIGEYGCEDVLTNRRLWNYIKAQMPADCKYISDVEKYMTRVLFDMERTGMRVDLQQLRVKEIMIYKELEIIDMLLQKRVGRSFRPHVNGDVYDVLCGQFGLPVLGWTKEEDELEDGEEANASFDKEAMSKYAVHPFAPHDVVELIIRYRHLNTLNNTFVRKYQAEALWHEDRFGGIYLMHPDYNQAVRTFRLSCKRPNAQQLSPEAKELILPPPGWSILTCDDSQIEYRTIVHYCRNERAIAAYLANPDTDFHQWVADEIGKVMKREMKRSPAKTCNFLMGYGGGKKRLERSLMMNTQLTGGVVGYVDQLVAEGKIKPEHRETVFEELASKLASRVYNAYHANLPELKATSRDVERLCRQRGYVKNVAGRRRHLPPTRAHIGFNAINQSSAADLMKERMCRLHKHIKTHQLPIEFMAQVHDDLSTIMPTELAEDPGVRREIAGFMENSDIKLRVPLRVAIGHSPVDWRRASKGLKDKSGKEIWPEPKPISYQATDLVGIENAVAAVPARAAIVETYRLSS